MRSNRPTLVVLTASLLVTASCQQLPGNEREQGAVIGGVAGAVVGNEVGGGGLGALIGGLAGAAGGYLIGAEMEKIDGDEDDRNDARAAVEAAHERPATAREVYAAETADLNGDGFVTTDELVAMDDAGLSDETILARLEATGQVFELTTTQEQDLQSRGISTAVIERMQELNQTARRRAGLADRDVLGRDR